MPNWVSNSVRISGPKENIKALVNHILSHKNKNYNYYDLSSFEKKPYPQTFLDYDTANYPNGEGLENLKMYGGKKITPRMIYKYKRATRYQKECYGVVGWYDYNVIHFGCKSNSIIDCFNQKFDAIEDEFSFEVDTPWSIPIPWLERISKDWKVTVCDKYSEEANNFGPGCLEFENGEQTCDCVYTRYVIDSEWYEEDERDDAISALEDLTGLQIDHSLTDRQLLEPEFLKNLEEHAPESKSGYGPLYIINPQ